MSFVRGRYIQGWVGSGRRGDGVGEEWVGSRRGVGGEWVGSGLRWRLGEEWVGSGEWVGSRQEVCREWVGSG